MLRRKYVDGKFERFKARLVARGFTMRAGVDFGETFSPVVNIASLRFFLAISAHLDLEILHLDVMTAFLNGDLEEHVYMVLPQEYNVNGKSVML